MGIHGQISIICLQKNNYKTAKFSAVKFQENMSINIQVIGRKQSVHVCANDAHGNTPTCTYDKRTEELTGGQ